MEWIQIAQVAMCTAFAIGTICTFIYKGIDEVVLDFIMLFSIWSVMEIMLGRWPKF